MTPTSGPPTVVSLTPAQLVEVNRLTLVARLLSAGVHDARNALQNISGMAELISIVPDSNRVEGRVQEILRSASALGDRLDGLVGLLAPTPPVSARVDLDRVARHVGVLRQASWGRAGVTYTTACSGAVAMAPEADLIRVVINLVLNAEQALSGSEGEITVSAQVEETLVTTLIVEDSAGMLPETAEQCEALFTPAGRVGAGISCGLYVSRYLLTRAGGSLTCTRTPDGRSRFVVRIPTGP